MALDFLDKLFSKDDEVDLPFRRDVETPFSTGVEDEYNPLNSAIGEITKDEGFRDTVYDDATGKPLSQKDIANRSYKGYPTVGYGYKLSPEEIKSGSLKSGESIYGGLPETRAKELISKSGPMKDVSNQIAKLKVDLSPQQVSALYRAGYNIGSGSLGKIIRTINKSGVEAGAKQLGKYTSSKGKTMKGLQERRKREVEALLGKPKKEASISDIFQKVIGIPSAEAAEVETPEKQPMSNDILRRLLDKGEDPVESKVQKLMSLLNPQQSDIQIPFSPGQAPNQLIDEQQASQMAQQDQSIGQDRATIPTQPLPVEEAQVSIPTQTPIEPEFNSPEPIGDSKTDLEKAIAQRDKLNLISMLIEGGSQALGGAMTAQSGYDTSPGTDLTQLRKMAEQKVSDIELKRKGSQNDPNSAESKRSRAMLKALGIDPSLHEGLSANDLRTLLPHLAGQESQKRSFASKKELAQMKSGGLKSMLSKSMAKSQAKDLAKSVDSIKSTGKTIDLIDDALDSQLKYSADSWTGGTGPIATLGGLTRNFSQDTEALDAKFKNISIKNMATTFEGMSKAVDSDAERAAWNATQASITNDDATNVKIMLGMKAAFIKDRIISQNKLKYAREHGNLDDFETNSPLLSGKMKTLVSPSGEITLVHRDEINQASAKGFITLDEHAEQLIEGKKTTTGGKSIFRVKAPNGSVKMIPKDKLEAALGAGGVLLD